MEVADFVDWVVGLSHALARGPFASTTEVPSLPWTQYVEVRRRFLREHPGHVLDGWPLPIDFLQDRQLTKR